MAASPLKTQEVDQFRRLLEFLRDRLQGDVEQMTREALHGSARDASGNLSNVPLHLADLGTENFDQDFTLGLIENEQETLEQIRSGLDRIRRGTYGMCQECQQPIARQRLQALPYTPHCIECARRLENGE